MPPSSPKNSEENLEREFSIPNTIFCLLIALLVAVVLYVFYNFELRQRLENRLFDLRTTLKPQWNDTSNIAIISIDREDIKTLEDPLARRISTGTIKKIGMHLHRSGCKSILILLPHQDFDYRSYKMKTLVDWIQSRPGIYLGIFDYHRRSPSEKRLPARLRPIKNKVFGISTTRRYRQEVVRSLPLFYYLGRNLQPALWTQVAFDHSPTNLYARIHNLTKNRLSDYRKSLEKQWHLIDEYPALPKLDLNYLTPERFTQYTARHLMRQKESPDLRDKIAIVGYKAFRSRSINHRDGTFVNTPWEGDSNPEARATPLIYVHATALHNLMKGQWLSHAPIWMNILQTITATVMSIMIWYAPSYVATLLFAALMITLLSLHSLIFYISHTVIPLADTMLFSVLATIGGALWRAQRDTKRRVEKQLSLESQQQFATIQARFLDRFAGELFTINEKITNLLQRHKNQLEDCQTVEKTYTNALTSNQELKEYLRGIKHYALTTQNSDYRIQSVDINLRTLMSRILSQFETIIEDNHLQIRISYNGGERVWCDEILLEPILFNLVSNAIKYSPKSGRVIIETVNRGDGSIRIGVRDQGPGIDPILHEKIFQKFYRIKDDNAYRVKGNGLGLFLCRFFAEKLGISLELSSKPGKGSYFSLKIPKKEGS